MRNSAFQRTRRWLRRSAAPSETATESGRRARRSRGCCAARARTPDPRAARVVREPDEAQVVEIRERVEVEVREREPSEAATGTKKKQRSRRPRPRRRSPALAGAVARRRAQSPALTEGAPPPRLRELQRRFSRTRSVSRSSAASASSGVSSPRTCRLRVPRDAAGDALPLRDLRRRAHALELREDLRLRVVGEARVVRQRRAARGDRRAQLVERRSAASAPRGTRWASTPRPAAATARRDREARAAREREARCPVRARHRRRSPARPLDVEGRRGAARRASTAPSDVRGSQPAAKSW